MQSLFINEHEKPAHDVKCVYFHWFGQNYLSFKKNNWYYKSGSTSGKSGLHKEITQFPCIISFLTVG